MRIVRIHALILLGLLGSGCLSACQASPRSVIPTETSAMSRPPSSAAAPGALAPEETRRVEALKAVLPEGWTVTRTARNVVPDEWISESAAGLLVEGQRGSDTFRVWFLPRD